VVRDLTDQELEHIRWVAAHYVEQWVKQGWHFQ
jgi:hypothetical protein